MTVRAHFFAIDGRVLWGCCLWRSLGSWCWCAIIGLGFAFWSLGWCIFCVYSFSKIIKIVMMNMMMKLMMDMMMNMMTKTMMSMMMNNDEKDNGHDENDDGHDVPVMMNMMTTMMMNIMMNMKMQMLLLMNI